MKTARRSLATLLITLCFVCLTSAQETTPSITQRPTVIVTATASNQRVRYASLGEVHQSRLQVFSMDGTEVFDSNFRLGNLIDWQLVDQQGTHLMDGSYLFLITVKDFADRLSQKYGTAQIEQEQISLQQTTRDELTQLQATALEANKLSEVLSPVDRIGVAAMNRSSTASDDGGTVIDAAPSGKNTATSKSSIGGENIGGTGSQNRVAKWIDDVGTLGNSTIFEDAAGKVGVGTDTPLGKFDVRGNVLVNGATQIVDGGNLLSIKGSPGVAAGNAYVVTQSGDGTLTTYYGTSSTGGFADTFNNSRFSLRTNNTDWLNVDPNGNVGIGISNPAQKLDVAGNIKISGAGNSIIFPDATTFTSANIPLSKITPVRVIISATNSPYLAGTAEDIIGVNVTSGPVTVTLPSANSVAPGKIVIVKNEAGDASVNNITIQRRNSDFINASQTSVVITFGVGTAAYKFYSDGISRWYQF